MDQKLTFRHDREGDILYIGRRPPYPEQNSEELGNDVIARPYPVTRNIESLEVPFSTTRVLRGHLCEMPVIGELRLAAQI